jgi:hypothetical protein
MVAKHFRPGTGSEKIRCTSITFQTAKKGSAVHIVLTRKKIV